MTNINDPNTQALDLYAKGWSRGDVNMIYPILENTYTLDMKGMEKPVNLQDMKQFFLQFRTDVAAAGGPGLDSDVFMKFKNVIRRPVMGAFHQIGTNHLSVILSCRCDTITQM